VFKKIVKKSIVFFENQPLTFGGWVISFFTLLVLNLFFQFITYGFKTVSFEYFIGSLIQPYYFILYIAIVIFLYYLTKENIKKILNFVLWGFWSIIFWPIIDKIILGKQFYLSFYIYGGVKDILNNFITFFGPINPVGILYGTRIETIFIILFVAIYVFQKTNSIVKTLFGGLGVYVIFYISVALPSVLVFLLTIFNGGEVMKITNLEVVKFFNTPFQYFGISERGFAVTFFYKISLIYNLIFLGLLIWLQYLCDKYLLKILIKNIRFPQMIFNWGLLLMGIVLGVYYWPNNLTSDFFSWLVLINLFFTILFSWLFSVIINDIEDYEIDKISNKNRPLVLGLVKKGGYLNYGLVFLFLSLLFSLIINSKIFLLNILYLLITLIYSKYPFKLKRVPWVAGIVSSFASLLIFLIGYILISPEQTIELFPWRVVLFLFGVYALVLPIKDLKDIQSDKKNNVLTVANLLGEKWARIYFGTIVFLAYVLSVFVLSVNRLFLPAVVLGGMSYWVINNSKNFRDRLLYKLLLLVIIYIGLLVFC
jgi:4-hydroxybenzoate polyprenyltransferase